MDKVKHWPSWANWYARDEVGNIIYSEKKPTKAWWSGYNSTGNGIALMRRDVETLEIVEIDPDTPWDKSLQRRPG